MALDSAVKARLLADHLPYELEMLRYSFNKLSPDLSQAEFNVTLEAFCIHARNLYHFLGNGDGVNAHEIIPNFKMAKTSDTIRLFPKINAHVVHLGSNRPSSIAEKLKIEDLRIFLDWIEQGIAEFISKLGPNDRDHWDMERQKPVDISLELTNRGATGPTGPTNAGVTASSVVHTVVSTGHLPPTIPRRGK